MKTRAVRRGTVAGVATYSMAYRSGRDVVDERNGNLYKHGWRWDVMGQGIAIPSQFQGNPDFDWARDINILSNAMEFGEQHRRHARVAREYMVVLPREMSDEQRFKLVSGFTQALSDRNQNAIHFAIHEPRMGRAYTHHAHLTATTRKVTLDGLGEKTDAERNHDGRLANNTGLTELQQVTQLWRAHLKAAMQEAGLKYSIDRLDYNGRKPRGFDAARDGDSYASYRRRVEEAKIDINEMRRADAARSRLTPEEQEERKIRKLRISLRDETGGRFDKQKHEQRSLEWFRHNVPIQKGLPPQRATVESAQNLRSRQPKRQQLDSLFDLFNGQALAGEQIKLRSVRVWEAFRQQTLGAAGRNDPERARSAEIFLQAKAERMDAMAKQGEAFAGMWERYQENARQENTRAGSGLWSEASLKNWESFQQGADNTAPARTFSELLRERSQQIWVAYRKSLGMQTPDETKTSDKNLIAAKENARRRDRGYGAELSYGYGYG